jgi:hypothetical protein
MSGALGAIMSVHVRTGVCATLAGAFLILQTGLAWAQAAAPTAKAAPNAALHDGEHDFDFLVGSWKIHLKRRLRPLTGSSEWVEFDGTVVWHKVWDGRAELEQFDVDSPEKHIKIHGLTLRLYDAKSHQWRIYWANADKGALDLPPVTGSSSNGRGEFYDQEERDGRPILVRYVWSGVATNSPHFEQSFSADWGKTWETNWITDQTKETP